MSFKKTISVLMCALVFGATAFADDHMPGDGKVIKDPGHGDENQVTRSVNWADFREACAHPMQFGNQRAPQNIKILCTNQQVGWVASAPGEVNLQGTRQITMAVTSDKFRVAPVVTEVPVYSRVGSCARFKEVVETYTAPERVVSCDEILGYKGELVDFCGGEIDKNKGANPKLVQVADSGRMIDTCGGGDGGIPPKPMPKN